MAGRGRGMTLPAWMVQQQQEGGAPTNGYAPPQQQPPAQQPYNPVAAAQPSGQYQPHQAALPQGAPGQFEDYGRSAYQPQQAAVQMQSQQLQQGPPSQQGGYGAPQGSYGAPPGGRRSRSPERGRRGAYDRDDRGGGGGGGYGGGRGGDRGGGYGGDRGDRGGGYGGRGGSGGGFGGKQSFPSRRRSPSRSNSRDRERRERRRAARRERGTNFDVRPAGIDDETAQQLVAQAFAQQTAPSTAGGMPAVPGFAPSAPLLQASTLGLSMQQTRHARRLYVGGVPPRAADTELRDFFNEVVDRALGKKVEGGAVLNVYLNSERGFAFVEMKTTELTSACLQLDGIPFGEAQLRIRRPSDYNPGTAIVGGPLPQLDLSALGMVSTIVPDGPNKVFVGGLPYHLTEDQVRELLSAFGPLKSLHLVKDAGSPTSKGYAFCEYADPAMTAAACEGLNNMQLGEKTLTVRPANPPEAKNNAMAALGGADYLGGVTAGHIPTPQEQSQLAAAMAALGTGGAALPGGVGSSAAAESALAASRARALQPTRILVLLGMVTEEELRDDNEYEDIVEDIQTECSSHGAVRAMVVPRPGQGLDAAVGRVFVEYGDPEHARKAALALAGRQFAARIVKVEYGDEAKFARRDFS